jgi:hypothetical protein
MKSRRFSLALLVWIVFGFFPPLVHLCTLISACTSYRQRGLIATSGANSSIDAFCVAIGVDVIVIQLNPSCICPNINVLVSLFQIDQRKASGLCPG